MKQKLICALLLLVGFISIGNAQNEFGFHAGGGISSLFYRFPAGGASSILDKKMDGALGFGGTAGLSYTFFFNPHWGLGSGVEFNVYTTKITLDNGFTRSYNTSTMARGYREEMQYTYSLDNYHERQAATLLCIPLMLQFQTGSNHQYYAAIGGKLGIPVSARYKSDASPVKTSGFFLSDGDTEDNRTDRGFGNFHQPSSSGSLSLKTAYMLSFETGMKWKAGKNALYTGIYVDYGLNNIGNPESRELIIYNGNSEPLKSNLLSASNNGTPMIDKVVPLAAGIKIKFAFASGKSRKQQPSARRSYRKQQSSARKSYREQQIETEEPVVSEYEILPSDLDDREALLQAEREKVGKIKADKQAIEDPIEDYELGKYELTRKQKDEIDEKIGLIKKYPHAPIIIYGHTCDLGGFEVNERMSIARAEVVKKYLISHDVDPETIILVSKRDTEVIAPNTKDSRKLNRRVEITILVNDVVTIELENILDL